jgi:hypothetical protein
MSCRESRRIRAVCDLFCCVTITCMSYIEKLARSRELRSLLPTRLATYIFFCREVLLCVTLSPLVFYSGQAQFKHKLIQERGCVSSFGDQHELIEDQAYHAEEHGISDREDHSNDPRHHRSTFFFLGLQGLLLCLGLRLPAIVINLRRAAIDMQGCFALAIINDFRKVSWQLPQGIATSEIDQRDMGSDISASEPLSINHSLFVFSAHPFDCGTAGSFSPKQSQPFWTEANDRAASDSIL